MIIRPTLALHLSPSIHLHSSSTVDFTSDGTPVGVAAGNLWLVWLATFILQPMEHTNHKFPVATATDVPCEVKSTVHVFSGVGRRLILGGGGVRGVRFFKRHIHVQCAMVNKFNSTSIVSTIWQPKANFRVHSYFPQIAPS